MIIIKKAQKLSYIWVKIKETFLKLHLIVSLQQLNLNGYDP